MIKNYILGVGESGRKRLETVDLLYGIQTKNFLQYNINKKGIRVLDLGCGLGHTSRALSKVIGAEGEVIAIDNSLEQLEIAKNSSKEFQNIKYLCVDVSKDNLDELGLFDIIYGRLILTHILNPLEVIKKISKLLPSDGLILLEEPVTSESFCLPQNIWFDSHLELYIKIGIINGLNYDFGSELIHIINKSGLKIESVHYSQSLYSQKNLKDICLLRTIECSKKYLKNNIISQENLDILLHNLDIFVNDEVSMFSGVKMCQFVIKNNSSKINSKY